MIEYSELWGIQKDHCGLTAGPAEDIPKNHALCLCIYLYLQQQWLKRKQPWTMQTEVTLHLSSAPAIFISQRTFWFTDFYDEELAKKHFRQTRKSCNKRNPQRKDANSSGINIIWTKWISFLLPFTAPSLKAEKIALRKGNFHFILLCLQAL